MINILVPTDFSAAAKKALEYAVTIAKKTNANVVILHIYQIPLISARMFTIANSEVIQENIRLAEEQLKNLEKEVPGLEKICYKIKTLPMYWQIEFPEIIQEQDADLIIMGTNGANGLKEIVLGSNTGKVIDRTKCPVLAVPVDAHCTKIGTIAFAYDREFIGDLTTFDFLIWFTRCFDALLEIFHVKSSENDTESTDQHINIHNLKLYLKEIQHFYLEIVGEDVEENINSNLIEKNIDVLVVMHRSRGLFERLFRRSFSKKMSYHTTIPLLVIPEKN